MSVCAKIGADIVKDCDNTPVMGIEQRLVLINVEDLPATGIEFDVTLPSALITGITLNALKTGYEVQGIKQIMSYTNGLETAEDSENGIKHALSGIRIYDPSEQTRNQVNKFVRGARVFAVLERKWKGEANAHAFLFFGLKFGLELSELTDSSNENDGTIVMGLSTPAGFKEPYLPHIYRDTDYPTSLTAFNNKFAAGV